MNNKTSQIIFVNYTEGLVNMWQITGLMGTCDAQIIGYEINDYM